MSRHGEEQPIRNGRTGGLRLPGLSLPGVGMLHDQLPANRGDQRCRFGTKYAMYPPVYSRRPSAETYMYVNAAWYSQLNCQDFIQDFVLIRSVLF